MENNDKMKKVMDTLQKLKAFYESAKKNDSEGEVEAAAAQINKLLIKYNLTNSFTNSISTWFTGNQNIIPLIFKIFFQ